MALLAGRVRAQPAALPLQDDGQGSAAAQQDTRTRCEQLACLHTLLPHIPCTASLAKHSMHSTQISSAHTLSTHLQALAQELAAHRALSELGLEGHLLGVPVLVILQPVWVGAGHALAGAWFRVHLPDWLLGWGARLCCQPQRGASAPTRNSQRCCETDSLLLAPYGVLVELLVRAHVEAAQRLAALRHEPLAAPADLRLERALAHLHGMRVRVCARGCSTGMQRRRRQPVSVCVCVKAGGHRPARRRTDTCTHAHTEHTRTSASSFSRRSISSRSCALVSLTTRGGGGAPK